MFNVREGDYSFACTIEGTANSENIKVVFDEDIRLTQPNLAEFFNVK